MAMMTGRQPAICRRHQRDDHHHHHQQQRARRRTSHVAAAAPDAAAVPDAASPSPPPPPPAPPTPGSDAFAAQQTSAVWRTLSDPPPVLRGLRVVLVAPKAPENIGAACRALANFECPDLVLVAPRTERDPRADGKVAAVACGDSVRAGMRVVATLEEALADCDGGSVGMTRRGGATRVTHESLDALEAAFPGAVLGGCGSPAGGAATSSSNGISSNDDGGASTAEQQQQQQQQGGLVALVFGREESGLTEGELRLCSHACAVPTGRVHASMNLAVAVAVALSWCFSRRVGAAEAAAAAAAAAAAVARAAAASGADQKNSDDGASPPSPAAAAAAAAAAVAVNPGIERSAAGDPRSQRGFLPVSAAELDALLDKAAALAIACGETPDESTGGGNKGTHGRRRKAQGHLRAVLQRARVTSWEARSLHGLFSAALRASGVSDERAALEGARERRRAWQRAQSGDAVAGRDEKEDGGGDGGDGGE